MRILGVKIAYSGKLVACRKTDTFVRTSLAYHSDHG
jgi:hypothetical protein